MSLRSWTYGHFNTATTLISGVTSLASGFYAVKAASY